MNTTENNKLIAEYMEFEKTKSGGLYIMPEGYNWERFLDVENYILPEQFIFHNDWNWLMLVTKKIFEETSHHTLEFEEYLYKVQDGVLQGDIIIVYEAVVKFIKWYNTSAKVLDIINKI